MQRQAYEFRFWSIVQLNNTAFSDIGSILIMEVFARFPRSRRLYCPYKAMMKLRYSPAHIRRHSHMTTSIGCDESRSFFYYILRNRLWEGDRGRQKMCLSCRRWQSYFINLRKDVSFMPPMAKLFYLIGVINWCHGSGGHHGGRSIAFAQIHLRVWGLDFRAVPVSEASNDRNCPSTQPKQRFYVRNSRWN